MPFNLHTIGVEIDFNTVEQRVFVGQFHKCQNIAIKINRECKRGNIAQVSKCNRNNRCILIAAIHCADSSSHCSSAGCNSTINKINIYGQAICPSNSRNRHKVKGS